MMKEAVICNFKKQLVQWYDMVYLHREIVQSNFCNSAVIQNVVGVQDYHDGIYYWMGTMPPSPIILQGDGGTAKKRIIVTFIINIEHQTLNGMNYETGLTWSLKLSGIVLNTSALSILSIFYLGAPFSFSFKRLVNLCREVVDVP